MTPAELQDDLRRRGRLMMAQADAALGITELSPPVELDAYDAGVFAGVVLACDVLGVPPALFVARLS